MRVYLAGPMSSIPLFNFPAFDAAAERWRAMGHDVVNPAELTRGLWRERFGHEFDPASTDPAISAGGDIYRDFLREDVRQIASCDAVALLPGWQRSRGVAVELTVTRALQLPELDAETGDPIVAPPAAAETAPSSKPTNPKDAIGSNKLPLHLFPLTAIAWGCLAFLEGLLKYGRSNYRKIGVRASIYYDAARRHVDAWFEGEDIDPESGLPHLAKALACIAVLIDADAAGKLNDDRMVPGGYARTLTDATPHVARLKALHADKAPRHYTIADSTDSAEASS